MMGRKAIEPKLYISFSLDQAVPAGHLVRRLAEAVDLGFVRGLVRDCYSDVGKPSVDPEVLFKLWMLGYLYGITSERRLCEEASLNLAWRWFLGYELDEPIPDHSVLTKARRRFGTRVYELFFRQIVQLCEARGLVQGGVVFIDSTLINADASQNTLRSRALTGQRLKEPRQFVRDLYTVNDPPLEPEPPRPKGPRGPKPGWSRAPNPSWRGSLVSTTDPDAELARRRDGSSRMVHKAHVTADGGKANIITAVDVGPAGDSDASTVGKMLDKHQINVGRRPSELVGDSGYGSDGAVRECLGREVVPTMQASSRVRVKDRFSVEDFTYVADRDVFICPAGQELHRSRERFQTHKTVYEPVQGGVCASCPLKAQCTPGKGDRMIHRIWDADILDEARAHLSAPRGRQRLQRRQIVSERIFADLKCKHGFDRAQFRGRPSVKIQALLTAAVFNLKQLMKRGPTAQAGWAAGSIDAVSWLLSRLQAGLNAYLGGIRGLPTVFWPMLAFLGQISRRQRSFA